MLPAEYQEVEWIRNTGTQYIATEYIPTKDDEIYTKVIPDASYTDLSCIFSAGTGTSQTIMLTSKSNLVNYCKYFATGGAAEMSYCLSHYNWNTIKVSKSGEFTIATIGASDVAVSAYQNELDGMQTTLYLLRRRNGINPFYGKMGKFRIMRNGVLKLHLIPCFRKLDDKTGMYDIVSMRFYPNAGSGEFELGPEVLPWAAEKRYKSFWRRRKTLIKACSANVVPLPDIDGVRFIGGLWAKMSRKKGTIHVESDIITDNPNMFEHVIYPTANRYMGYTGNYCTSSLISVNNSVLIHPGTYRVALNVKTNIPANVCIGTASLGEQAKQVTTLLDGEQYLNKITVAKETRFYVVLGFRPHSLPSTLDADIKLSLVKIG